MTKKSTMVIITGYSGAGKTTFTKILEDMEYFVIDNLPFDLFTKFMELLQKNRIEQSSKLALVVDIREEKLIKELPAFIKKMKKKGVPLSLIFLKANKDSLILRYKRTRRPHPLSKMNLSLEESIDLEQKILEPIEKIASLVIDTSDKTPQDLKELVTATIFNGKKKSSFFVNFESFGFMYGIPEKSDLVFDVRSIPNPYYVDIYKEKTGLDKDVVDFLMKFDETKRFIKNTINYLKYFLKEAKKDRFYINISIGCTGGKHRSVAIAEYFTSYFKEKGYETFVFHRDIKKGYDTFVNNKK